jgi:hypothetical protein
MRSSLPSCVGLSPLFQHHRRKKQVRRFRREKYKATTNRMLRVAVNGFMESLGLVLGIMEELDVDVLAFGTR